MADGTQPLTQLDPRRLGRNNSGLRETDVSDVLCILHPGSPAAFRIVARTALNRPEHVLQNWTSFVENEGTTFIVRSSPDNAQDLALRFSSATKYPQLGFVFGRAPKQCDIVLVDELDNTRRVSNLHFRIFVKENGVLMLEDQSTNGTLVDDQHIKGRKADNKLPSTRVLENGSTIAIPSPIADQRILFHVRIPSREGLEQQFRQNFVNYLTKLAHLQPNDTDPTLANVADPTGRTLIINSSSFGMKWNGGTDYRVSGFLGKGAFANVYRLTTRIDGTYLAVKELEKRRFVKDGIVDRRLSNEMAIMKTIKHDRIVKYIEHKDVHDHLYIIMEYVPCGDLQQYLKNGFLSEANGKMVARQVLDALSYLHQNNITHRDIKPDNILIESKEPISVKLSDFGLSKVRTEDTFLKTFCGTLLYCAPEVFPHYQNDKQGVKRRHGKKTYSYDHAVDIWSLGGVLWYAMTNFPPFEGVVDPTGRGMYDRIMQTEPNVKHLDDKSISQPAKDLLKSMLTIQPDRRPSAIACLSSPWLYDGIKRTLRANELNSIVEEVEEADKFSQLSLRDGEFRDGADHDEIGFIDDADLDDMVNFDPQVSARFKRVKVDGRYPRNQIRDNSDKESSDDHPPSAPENVVGANAKRRLFGEIGASALQDSGVLGEHTKQALTVNPRTPVDFEDVIPSSHPPHPPQPEELSRPAESLFGTTSLVGNLNMESPISSDWFSSHESSANSLQSRELPNRQPASFSSQETPKGHHSKLDSQAGSTPTARGTKAMPDTMYQPNPEKISEAPSAMLPFELTANARAEFKDSPPRFGTLITTQDSEKALFLPINTQHVSWGRVPSNTLVYADNMDTRVPKRAFALMFHDDKTDESIKSRMDWVTLPHLHVWIKACSTHGLWINGVRLEEFGPNGESLFGNLYSGDVITIIQPKDDPGGGCLRFVCNFTVGQAQRRRTTPFEIIEIKKTTKRTQPVVKARTPRSSGVSLTASNLSLQG